MPGNDIPMPTPTINPPPPLASYKIISFDVYGTLIRYKSHILSSFTPLLSRLPSDSQYLVSTPLSTTIPNSATTGQITFLKLFQQKEDEIKLETPPRRFDQILSEIWTRIAAEINVSTTAAEASDFGSKANIASWPTFTGTVTALQTLHSRGYKLVALSNIDKFAWDITAPASGLDQVSWHKVFTAEDFGTDLHKADEAKLETLIQFARDEGVAKEEILHVAQSLGHDHAPAKKLGLSSVFLVGDGPVWGKEGESRMAVEKGLVGYGWRCEDLKAFVDVVTRLDG